MRALTIGIAFLLCSTIASAQGTETARFRSRVGAGVVAGAEEYSIVTRSTGYDITGKVAMKRGGADVNVTYRQLLTVEWATESYVADMTGALGTASVSAERKGEVLAFAVKTPTGTPTKEIPIGPRMVLMDNMLAAPLQVLINVTGGKAGTLTAVIPFQLATVEGRLEAAGTETGTLDGKPVTATKLRLTIAAAVAELLVDPATKRLLRFYVPAQDAELVREGFVPGAGSAPKPVELPAGVTERTVTFKSIDGVAYPAVLCLPKTPTPAPLVVMIQGSGPSDRDETIGPNKPFREIAWGLAQRGVATMRYDKRTYAFPTSYKGSLDSESIDDAVDALKFAQTVAEIDRDRLFVLGHSLGGLAALYVAERTPVRGLILLATGGRPMDQVIREQVKFFNAGKTAAEQAEVLRQQDAIMAKVRAGTATAQELQGQPLGALQDMITRDPIAQLQKTRMPLLVLKGDKDAQVFQADFDALQAVAAARPGSEAKLFPNLSHIFTPNEGPVDFRAIFQPGHIPPEVIDTIAGWVTKTAKTTDGR